MLGALRTLFLILTFVLGQSHLCASEYMLPSGQVCSVCETLVDPPQLESGSFHDAVQARHGDCHDCCSIKSCDTDPQPLKTDFSPAPVNAAVLPPTFVVVPLGLVEIRTELPAPVELYLPCGPPSDRSSRAPPIPFV